MHWIALQPLSPLPPLPSEAADSADWDGDLTGLGWWALQFTPKVARVSLGLNAETNADASADASPGASANGSRNTKAKPKLKADDALVMEVSASERLFGGRSRLLEQMFKSNKSATHFNCARGPTSLIALARLQMPAGAPRVAPDALPLRTLEAARAHEATLARLGCTCWGDLRALPRDGLARRFGAELLDALDRAYGLKPELYPWLVLPDVLEIKLELQAQIDTAPALLFGARRLLKQLQVWLQLRTCGVLALELGWTMDARRNTATEGSLVLRTAEPTQDMAHLQRLLAENLARITLPAPALYLHLRTLQTEKLAGQSASLLLDDIQKGDSLHQMLERVSARLGADSVLQLQPHADHRPEHMQTWRPVFDAPQLIAVETTVAKLRRKDRVGSKTRSISKSNAPGIPTISDTPARQHLQQLTLQGNPLYPTWLLAKPLALAVHGNTPLYLGPLTLLAGPQRLETGWWGAALADGDCALRDYFVARNEQSGLLWIYRERLGGAVPSSQGPTLTEPSPLANSRANWYLHGLYA